MALRDIADRWADVAIGLVSPRRRALREHFRRLDSDVDYRELFFSAMRARGYRSAKSTDFQTAFSGSGASADSQVASDLPALCSRSQELNRDDPIASGLTNTLVRSVVGTGMRAQARTQSAEKNRALEAHWRKRCDGLFPADDMTHGESQRMRLHKLLEDGSFFQKVSVSDPSEPVWFEVIEKARVSTPMSKAMREASLRISDGVEKDEWGRPVAYWVSKGYPEGGASPLSSAQYSRVPKEHMRHARLATRPGQTHGVPIFHAILQDIRDLDLLMLASLKRVQIAACLSVFIRSPKAMDDLFDTTAREYGMKIDQPIEPGMIFKLYPDEEVQTLVPNFPTPELGPFVVMLARRIGAAIGVSWQIVLKDFSESTYSSARTDLLEARPLFRVLESVLIEKALNWDWRVVQEDGLLRGEPLLVDAGIGDEDIDLVSWIPNGRPWIDPQKEANATKTMLEIGLTCLRDEAAALGKDWEDLQDQILREELRMKVRREELGLLPWDKERLDAYGVAVRAGALTPQIEDEQALRGDLGLPPVGAPVESAWTLEGGVRKPITLASEESFLGKTKSANRPPFGGSGEEEAEQENEQENESEDEGEEERPPRRTGALLGKARNGRTHA